MDLFTEAYKKAREIATGQTFDGGSGKGWDKFLKTDAPLPSLFANGGPDVTHSAVPGKVRAEIQKNLGGFWAWLTGRKEADVIWAAAGGEKGGSREERAAALKFARHFYRIDKKGAQDVWVYNPPKDHTKWIFDEIKPGDGSVKTKLADTIELFSEAEMKHMADALKIALAATQKALMKVNSPDDATKQMIRDWFCDDHSSDDQLDNVTKKLKAGLGKIVNLCNSNKLVFTDLASWRANRDKYFGGAVRGGEGGGFPVIYLEGAFTKLTGNSGKMWLCAETIVHEASHHEVSTQDHFYDHHGLKPSSNKFPWSTAIDNADNWGYFVIDIDGKLSTADRTKVLKNP